MLDALSPFEGDIMDGGFDCDGGGKDDGPE